VANHLNDVSRLSARTALATAIDWSATPDMHTAGLVRHAMRTLVTAGDAAALQLLGFTADLNHHHVSGPHLTAAAVVLGDAITFYADITNAGDQAAVLADDYVVHHQKANGTTTAKTFKLTTKTVGPQERIHGDSQPLLQADNNPPLLSRSARN
jgi:hypothetical protein